MTHLESEEYRAIFEDVRILMMRVHDGDYLQLAQTAGVKKAGEMIEEKTTQFIEKLVRYVEVRRKYDEDRRHE